MGWPQAGGHVSNLRYRRLRVIPSSITGITGMNQRCVQSHRQTSLYRAMFASLWLPQDCSTGITSGSVRDSLFSGVVASDWLGRFVFTACLIKIDGLKYFLSLSLSFGSIRAFRLMWRGLKLPLKSQLITRNGTVLPPLYCIHGKVLSHRPSGFEIVRPKIFHPSVYFLSLCPSIPLLSTTITRWFNIIRYLFQIPNNTLGDKPLNSDNWKKLHFFKLVAYPKFHISLCSVVLCLLMGSCWVSVNWRVW